MGKKPRALKPRLLHEQIGAYDIAGRMVEIARFQVTKTPLYLVCEVALGEGGSVFGNAFQLSGEGGRFDMLVTHAGKPFDWGATILPRTVAQAAAVSRPELIKSDGEIIVSVRSPNPGDVKVAIRVRLFRVEGGGPKICQKRKR